MIHNFSAQQSCILENMPKLGDSVLPLILGQQGFSTNISIHLASMWSTSDSFWIEEKSK
jgi:hypothetical protein